MRNQVDYDTLMTLKNDFDVAFTEMTAKIKQKAQEIMDLNSSKGWSGASGNYFMNVYTSVSDKFASIQQRFDSNLAAILDKWYSEFSQSEADAQAQTNSVGGE